ncbi:energy-coupling factor transporter transmembrane protein EcfT [Alicyclobacillus sp. SO9]|uniref:energy-coupling factor transporter transmembrane component T family protein n=1 Tax=Alicyclobacillus sp. SO9 TaxID=2665646 RepID=UPI0018E89353|nr:energy-coupling factor transporter transmembrane component T [Alicyclobacillus sp. SO9]QQE78208.1 energy-coupling factor transporter transmembrane protein EcfT [Alicyclobacillus sp. SO9]
MSTAMLLHTLWVRTIIGYLLLFTIPLILPALFIKLVGFKGLRNLLSYESRQTFVHRLDPRIKIIYPLCVGILSVFLNWKFVYGLLFVTVIPWVLLRPSSQRLRVLLTMTLAPAIGMVWQQGMYHTTTGEPLSDLLFKLPPTLSWLGTPGLQRSGTVYGLQEAGRMLVASSSSFLLIMTTKPSDIIWAYKSFRLPATVGLVVSVALRFLPKMFERMTTLLQAMEVRGYSFDAPAWYQVYLWPNYIVRMLVSIPTVTIPLLIGSLRETAVMAMVVDARAFGSTKVPTTYRQYQLTAADKSAWAALAILCIVIILLLIFHIGNRHVIGLA